MEKVLKKFGVMLLVMFAIIGVQSGLNASAAVPITGLELNKTSAVLKIGQSDTLVAKITPSTATNKVLKWESSDEEVAIVDKAGKVTAKGCGYAFITATTIDGSELSVTYDVEVVKDIQERAELSITLINNEVKTYDILVTELNSFITWVNTKGAKVPYYIFENEALDAQKTNSDYIFYNTIFGFNVKKYDVKIYE